MRSLHQVGINLFESLSCWLADCGNAASPATMAAAMKMMAIMLQITPQHLEDPPYLCAKTLASEELTLRRMRSSHYLKTDVSEG
jgi:hypothetical protein